ncbi:MAG: hypothetical protein J2P15_18830 [Micromonosporaceae bacterium]|nr:hypothetical protein [Micromonosporaceae bacterium]
MSMIVVYATSTLHTLGVLAPAGQVGAAPEVSALVGDSLPLWAGQPTGKALPLTFLATELASAVVTDQPDALVAPLAFGVQVKDGEPLADLLALRPGLGGNGPLAPPPKGVTVTADPNGVTVTLPQPADRDLAVLVVVGNASATQHPPGSTIRQGTATATIPITLDAGPYAILALVSGWRGVMTQGPA